MPALIVTIVVIALTYLLVTLLPLPQPVKTVLAVLVVLFGLVWVLTSFRTLGPPFRVR